MKDPIERQDVIDAIENVDWYHQNKNKDMVHGANSSEDQAWYKADDIYKTLEALPSAQPEIIRCKDCLHWVRTCGDNKWGLGDCDVFDKHLVMCEGYCAWAERRTDD